MEDGDAKEAVKKQLEAIARQISLIQQQMQALRSEGTKAAGIPSAKSTDATRASRGRSLQIGSLSGGTVDIEV